MFNARIVLDFKIDGNFMGEEIEISGKPRIVADVQGTDKIQEVVVVRDGAVIHTLNPKAQKVQLDFVDNGFAGKSYYYLRAVQADKDEHGNPSHAWSSPIWVKKR